MASEHAVLGPEERRKLLRGSFIFRDVDEAAVDRLAAVAQVRTLERGQLLFSQGDDGNALYAVAGGLVRIWIGGAAGKELTLAMMEQGDVFGEIALLDGLSRTTSATAAADCSLLVLGRAPFLEVLRSDGNLAQHLIELLCERMRNNTETISDFAFLDLRGRLARKLHELAIAHGEQTKAGILIGLKLSQSELAQMLGVTREAVNKQLHAWADKHVLKLDKGKVVVRDMTALKRAAEPARE
ncbi:MAG: Crp/Fnr family transcriptional regulator [Reyranellaceae bacterium]